MLKNIKLPILCLYFITFLEPLYFDIITEPPIDNPKDIEFTINIIEAQFPNAVIPSSPTVCEMNIISIMLYKY